jgi:lysyl-tRNA synthetase class I
MADAVGIRRGDVRARRGRPRLAGSSFTVGADLVTEIFGGQMPLHFVYSFAGTSGSAKMSGSAGAWLKAERCCRVLLRQAGSN